MSRRKKSIITTIELPSRDVPKVRSGIQPTKVITDKKTQSKSRPVKHKKPIGDE